MKGKRGKMKLKGVVKEQDPACTVDFNKINGSFDCPVSNTDSSKQKGKTRTGIKATSYEGPGYRFIPATGTSKPKWLCLELDDKGRECGVISFCRRASCNHRSKFHADKLKKCERGGQSNRPRVMQGVGYKMVLNKQTKKYQRMCIETDRDGKECGILLDNKTSLTTHRKTYHLDKVKHYERGGKSNPPRQMQGVGYKMVQDKVTKKYQRMCIETNRDGKECGLLVGSSTALGNHRDKCHPEKIRRKDVVHKGDGSRKLDDNAQEYFKRRFDENPNPTTAEYFVMKQESKVQLSQIHNYFSRTRIRKGINGSKKEKPCTVIPIHGKDHLRCNLKNEDGSKCSLLFANKHLLRKHRFDKHLNYLMQHMKFGTTRRPNLAEEKYLIKMFSVNNDPKHPAREIIAKHLKWTNRRVYEWFYRRRTGQAKLSRYRRSKKEKDSARKGYRLSGSQLKLLEELVDLTKTYTTFEKNTFARKCGLTFNQITKWMRRQRSKLENKHIPKVIMPSSKQLKQLQTEFFKKKYHNIHELLKLAMETGLKPYQVKKWMMNAQTSSLNFTVGELNGSQEVVTLGSIAAPLPPILNDYPAVFWSDTNEEGIATIHSRNLGLHEVTDEYHQVYYTPWKLVDPITDEIVQKNVAVGMTAMRDVRAAARCIWDNILQGGEDCCSYRYWHNERGWTPDNDAARSFGIYCMDEDIARTIKWWMRLRLLSIGTLKKHESVLHLHRFAQYLDETAWSYFDEYPDYIKRWLDFTQQSMQNHIVDPLQTFPGIDYALFIRHECITTFAVDPGLNGIQNALIDAPIVPPPHSPPNLYFINLNEDGTWSIQRRDLAVGENTDNYFQIYYTPWQLVDPITGETVPKNVAVGMTAMRDVRAAARCIWDNILQCGENCCSYRYWHNERGWTPDNDASRSFGIYCMDEVAARTIKWWMRLRLLSIGTFKKHESVLHLHPFVQHLEDVVNEHSQLYPTYTQQWLSFTNAAMQLHIHNPVNTFPGIDHNLIVRHEVRSLYGVDPGV